MKRSRAILLFSILTLTILGYLAWCGRCFYLDQELAFHSEPSAEVRAAFEEWYAMTHVDLRAELTKERFFEHLKKPGSDDDRVLTAWRMPGGGTGPAANLWMLNINRSDGVFTVLVNRETPDSPYQWKAVYSPPVTPDDVKVSQELFELTNMGAGTPLPPDIVERAEEIIQTAR